MTAIERLTWVRDPQLSGATNERLARTVWIADRAPRVDVIALTASATLAPTYPHTLYKVTLAGNVTLTLPPARTVPGFRVDVKKLTAAHTLTVDGDGAETIDGAATSAWTTAYESRTFVSDGAEWSLI